MSGFFNMLLGLRPVSLSIVLASVTDVTPGATATATATYESDGDVISTTFSGGAVDAGDWIAPRSFAPGPYTIRANIVSGTLSGGDATATDLPLTSTRSWYVEQTIVGTKTCTILVQIKNAAGVVMAQANVVLTATRD